jgi:GNAT superfamily N-acetyltransferase
MIRVCGQEDFAEIWAIINDGAKAYKGVIPEDCSHEPYINRQELQDEIDAGVIFWGFEENGALLGVMGTQSVQDVTLIRHAYVRSTSQRRGIGAQLLAHLRGLTGRPVLIGTWAAADWAIRFYRKYGFAPVPSVQKDQLLQQYWTVSARQRQVSVVLAETRTGPKG